MYKNDSSLTVELFTNTRTFGQAPVVRCPFPEAIIQLLYHTYLWVGETAEINICVLFNYL